MRRVQVGDWIRFPGINDGNLVYIHRAGDGYNYNGVWLPSMTGCMVSVGKALRNGAIVDEVTDEMLAHLATWRLLGSRVDKKP